MVKISKLFGMLVLGLASSGLAMNTLTLSCTTTEEYLSEPDETGFQGNAYWGFDCSISQLSSQKEELSDNEYATWDELLGGIHHEVNMADGLVSHVNITLASDIVFDAIPTNPAECTNSMMGEFELYFPGMGDAENNFNGNGHTISNFCRISEGMGDAAFFKEYKNGSIKNVIFDNAYVLSKLSESIYATEARAAVVVSQAIDVVFDSVVVKNSKVYGLTAGAVADSIVNGSLKRISVVNTDVGAPAAVFPEYTGGRPDATSIYTAVGGVAAYTNGVGVFENISLTGVSVGVSDVASVPYEFMGPTEMVHETAGFYMREIGGVIGDASYYSSTFSYKGGSVGVTVGNGAYMGGIFGKLYARSNSIEVNNVSANVTVQPTCQSDYYVGGLAGSADISLSNFHDNKVTMSADWVSSTCDERVEELFMGGLVGYTEYQQMQLDLFSDTVTTTIAVGTAYNGGSHSMGGLLGAADYLSVRMKDNVVTTNISDLASSTTLTQVGGLVGAMQGSSTRAPGPGRDLLRIYRNDVNANLKVESTSGANMGGLVGGVQNNNIDFEIAYNKGQGNIDVPSADGVVAGYGVGSIISDNLSAAGNFYVGTSDSNVPDFAGLYRDATGQDVAWKTSSDREGYTDICYNYRNTVDGLEATSGQWFGTSGEFYSEDEDTYTFNGVLSESEMKTCAFAYVLNNGAYRKNIGGLNDAAVIVKSWLCEDEDFPSYDDDAFNAPYAPAMLTIDYSSVADQMNDARKELMAPYMYSGTTNEFNTFTTKSRKLSEDFVAAFKSLDIKNTLMDEYSNVKSLNDVENELSWGSDQKLYVLEDRQFTVSYEYTVNGSSYSKFDESDGEIFFYTPKVVNTSLTDDDHLVPSIRTVGGISREYRLHGFIIDCEESSSCKVPLEDFHVDEHVSSFAKLLRSHASADFTGLSRNIRLIYKNVSDNPNVKALPAVYFAYSGNAPIKLIADSYGYTNVGEKASVGQGEWIAGSSSIDYLPMASQIGFAASTGYTASGWTVDLWVGFEGNYTQTDFNSCYDKNLAESFCSEKVIAASAERNLGSVSGLTDSIKAKSSDNAWKWTINLAADETINMENLIRVFSEIAYNGFDNPVVYMHVSSKGAADIYMVTFLPNETSLGAKSNEVFFGESWGGTNEFSIESGDLPKVYSTAAGFEGWIARPSVGDTVTRHKVFTSNFIDAVDVTDNAFNTYASWNVSFVPSTRILTLIADTSDAVLSGDSEEKTHVSLNGQIALVQDYERNGEMAFVKHWFADASDVDDGSFECETASLKIPAVNEPMTFRVEAVPNPGYKLESLTWRSNKPKKEGYGLLIGTDTTFRVEAYVSSDPTEHYLVAKFAPVPYHFTFNRELGTDWFYAKDWRDTAIYTIDAFGSGQSEFPRLYSVKGWTEGWYARLDGDYDCSPTFYHETSCMETGAYRENDTLHVFVYEEDNFNEVVSINKDAANMVRLVQFIGSKDSPFGLDSISHSFMIAETDGEMEIPLVENAEFEFVLRTSAGEGVIVDTVVLSYMMEGQDGPEPFEESLVNGDLVLLNLSRMRHVRFDARIRKLEYQITFENPVVEDVMVDGENFDKKGYSADSTDFSFPNMIYTNESCLLGWKLKSSEDKDNNDLVMKYFNWEDAKLMTEGENVLTAVWGDGAACDIEVNDEDTLAGEYARLVLEAEGGNVQLVQMNRDENDEVHEVRTRQFGAGKFMLFPIEFRNETWFIVNIKADEGYVAPDSILFYYDAKRAGEFTGDLELDSLWLKDGDTLPRHLFGSVLKADFRLANDTPIEFASAPEFKLAGSAARLNFVTREFAVNRNVLVKTSVIFDGDTNVVVDTVKNVPYEFSWAKVGLAPGKYGLSVQMYDATESASFDTSFVVNGGIEASAMDGWQMLALSVIDKKSVDWTDTDAVFYWWDEHSSVGEYWRYRAYGEKDEVDAGVGGWYSSLSGNSLAVRDTEIPERVEWLLDSVNTGWNMVANPYGWVVALPDMSFESYRWNSEICDYDSVAPRYLKPYEAIWIHVGSDTVLTLDKTPVFDTATVQSLEKHHALAKANSKFDWSIRASLKDEKGRTDSWNVLGVGDEVKMEEPPEGMGNHVRLSVMDGRKRLAKSMKAASEEGYTWNLEVSASSDRRGYLSFEGLDQVAAFGYRLFVTVDDRTVELSAGEQMPVALKTTAKSVKVQVVKSEAQLATSVSGLRMVQQGHMVNVSFNVPSNLAGRGFVAEVSGLDGKMLSSRSGKALSGRNEVSMDFPKSGLYFVRVRVASQQTAGKFLAK